MIIISIVTCVQMFVIYKPRYGTLCGYSYVGYSSVLTKFVSDAHGGRLFFYKRTGGKPNQRHCSKGLKEKKNHVRK